MKTLYLVNASPILSDEQVRETVAPLQTQINQDFMPHWQGHVVEPHIRVEFARARDIPHLPPDCWPIFHNRHSNEADALGWHDNDPNQNIRTYSRVFVGDCMQLGLNWQTTQSHEALELIGNPTVNKVYRMPNGEYAAYEVCDAVEADEQAYSVNGYMASNFVFPNYFSKGHAPFDYQHILRAPCPELTPGGYMPVTKRGSWTQVTMDRKGLMGRRAAMHGQRRAAIANVPMDQLEVM